MSCHGRLWVGPEATPVENHKPFHQYKTCYDPFCGRALFFVLTIFKAGVFSRSYATKSRRLQATVSEGGMKLRIKHTIGSVPVYRVSAKNRENRLHLIVQRGGHT